MNQKTYDLYTGPLPEWWDRPDMEEVQKAYSQIRDSIQAVLPLEDGGVVPREWAQQFPPECRSMISIGEHINGLPGGFFPEGSAFASLAEFRKAQGMEYDVYCATLNYFATGEGLTLKLFAHKAHSMGEFILSLEEDPYFVQGMDFYKGPPPEEDKVYAALATDYVRQQLRQREGQVKIKLSTYLNMS